MRRETGARPRSPTARLFFGPSNIKDLTFSVTTTIGGWTFNSNASHYSFDIPTTPDLAFDGLEFVGAGIVVKGGRASITNGDHLKFFNASTAGSAHITNHSNVSFYNSSTAGSSKFTNDNFLQFFQGSTAGHAHITNSVTGTVQFLDTSSAAESVIFNQHVLSFNNANTAGRATITNVGGGDVDFYARIDDVIARRSAARGKIDHTAGLGDKSGVEGAGQYEFSGNHPTLEAKC